MERWSLEPELRIGEVDGDAALTTVGSILIDSAGRLYVAQLDASSISVFGQDGEFLHDIGRRGEGPGEFLNVTDLSWVDGTLAVADMGQRRISFFRADGLLLEVRTPEAGAGPTESGGHYPVAAMVGGALMAQSSASGPAGGVAAHSERAPLLRFSYDGAAPDTLAWYEPNQALLVQMGEASMSWTSHDVYERLSRKELWAVAADGRSVVFLERPEPRDSSEGTMRLLRITAAGDTVLDRTVRYTPAPASTDVVDEVVEPLVNALERRGQSGSEIVDAIHRAIDLPTHLPPVTSLMAGRDGTIWLGGQPRGDGTQRWTVVSAEGQPVATTDVPGSVELREADRNHVWGVQHDELDVPYVVRFRIESP